ncbi:MAG: hypothetical protein U1F43_02105 [Myxococcota bacterium]
MAWVTGTLRRVHEVASSVSLAALNARVIAARAGAAAMGFVPITHSVDGLARDVDQSVTRIERTAVRAAQCAALAYIVAERAGRFESGFRRLESPDPSLDDASRRFAEIVANKTAALRSTSTALMRDLDRVDALLRSSLTLSTLSRIEASRAQSHRSELAAIGDAIDEAAEVIRKATTECRARLSTLTAIRAVTTGSR